MMRLLLTRRWIVTTLLVIAAVAVMVRLGIWQLDRLQQRRVFNASVEAQMAAPTLDLNQAIPTAQLTGMEYRQVVVRGEYDPQAEIILRNQVYGNAPGYHLLTPLRIAGSQQAVLVDRGFIPLDQAQPAQREKYAQPGEVTVHGIIRVAYVPRLFGAPDPTLAPGETHLDAWNAINLPRIQAQTTYPLLPVYVEAAPANDPNGTAAATLNASQAAQGDALFGAPAPLPTGPVTYPVASLEQPDLTEGPHLGYAVQWFSFAAILALGYPYFIRRQLRAARVKPPAQAGEAGGSA